MTLKLPYSRSRKSLVFIHIWFVGVFKKDYIYKISNPARIHHSCTKLELRIILSFYTLLYFLN